jgi:2-polyprenyl-3-methyl-5-hydroxy-6-metoxy-1,4-benzoquinol methylase
MQSPSLEQLERQKYENVWTLPAYRKGSPGECVVDEFIDWIEDGNVIDLGCGTGRASLKISKHNPVTMIDISENCLDKEVIDALSETLTFTQACLWDFEESQHDYGFCCDVMEHIPPEKVSDVITCIASVCKRVYFRIYLNPDSGHFVKEPLHLTVKPKEWWLEELKRYFHIDKMSYDRVSATYFARRK